MRITFLGTEIPLGNVAELLAVWVGLGGIAVAALAAAATIVVGVLAWLTSRRATEIAGQAAAISREATRIANEQLAEVQRHREATAAIVGSLISGELNAYASSARWALDNYVNAIRWGDPSAIADRERMDAFIAICRNDGLPTTESVFDRLHTFPAPLGNHIASLLGGVRSAREIAVDLASDIEYVEDDERLLTRYFGGENRLRLCLAQLTLNLEMAIRVHQYLSIVRGTQALDLVEHNKLLAAVRLSFPEVRKFAW